MLPWQQVNETVAMAMVNGDSFLAYLWAVSNMMVFPTIEALNGHSPQPVCGGNMTVRMFKVVALFSNVLTVSPHSASLCLPRTAPYTPENSYTSQGHVSPPYTPQKAILHM